MLKQYVRSLFLSFILLSFVSCEQDKPGMFSPNDSIIIVPSLETRLLKIYSYDRESRISVVIVGEKNTLFKNSKEIWLDNIRSLHISYEKNETIYIELKADKGKVNYETLHSEAWGNTVIIKNNEMRIETEKVFWDNDKQIFFTKGEEEVVIYKQDYDKDSIVKVVGTNLIADEKLQTVELDRALSIAPPK